MPLSRPRENVSLLETWRQTGHLPPEIEAAAYEIENVFRALTAGLWTKTASYGERTSPGPHTDWPARLAAAYGHRYKPWMVAMSVRFKQTGINVHELVTDAIIEGYSLRELDRIHKWRKGNAAKIVRWGLWEYCVMARWVDKHPQADTTT